MSLARLLFGHASRWQRAPTSRSLADSPRTPPCAGIHPERCLDRRRYRRESLSSSSTSSAVRKPVRTRGGHHDLPAMAPRRYRADATSGRRPQAVGVEARWGSFPQSNTTTQSGWAAQASPDGFWRPPSSRVVPGYPRIDDLHASACRCLERGLQARRERLLVSYAPAECERVAQDEDAICVSGGRMGGACCVVYALPIFVDGNVRSVRGYVSTLGSELCTEQRRPHGSMTHGFAEGSASPYTHRMHLRGGWRGARSARCRSSSRVCLPLGRGVPARARGTPGPWIRNWADSPGSGIRSAESSAAGAIDARPSMLERALLQLHGEAKSVPSAGQPHSVGRPRRSRPRLQDADSPDREATHLGAGYIFARAVHTSAAVARPGLAASGRTTLPCEVEPLKLDGDP